MHMTNRESLLSDQYGTPANLNARLEIHRRFSTNPYGWHRWVFDQIDPSPAEVVLELGCGSGALWGTNSDRLPGARRIILSDLSPGMLEDARRALGGSGIHAMYMVADAQRIPIGDGCVDRLIADHMIYHIPDRVRALSEMRRVLRPGGRLYAATNGSEHLRELEELILTVVPGFPYEHPDFVLEDGADLLSEWFGEVEVRLYHDALEVTDAGLLMAYILSLPESGVLEQPQVDELRRLIEQRIGSRGAYHITKAAGVFIGQ